MKRLFTVLVLALLVCASGARAQVKFGLRAGANLSHVHFSKKSWKTSDKTGFFVGPTVEAKLPLVGLGLDVSLLYNNQVISIEDEDKTLHYIDVPVNLKYSVGLSSLASLYLATGPQYSYNVGDRNFWERSYSLKSSQFSWNVGGGIRLLSHLDINYAYNIAVSKTADVKFGTVTDALFKKHDARCNTHKIGLTYFF